MPRFAEFYRIYPRPTAIGAARRSWNAQIFFHAADPEQIVAATKAFAAKHAETDKSFIPYPAKYLDDQVYLDGELQIKPAEPLVGWQAELANTLGEAWVRAWCTGATYEGGILKVNRMADWLKNTYSVQLERAGVKNVI